MCLLCTFKTNRPRKRSFLSRGCIKNIIDGYGYDVKVIEEAVAIGYEGLVDNNLTGIAISMGAGMCNIAVMYAGMSALSFSVARGGDWIDINSCK